MHPWDGSVRQREKKIVGKVGEIGNIHTAVTPVPFPEFLGFEMLPTSSMNHLAAHQALNEVRRGAGKQAMRAHCRWIGVLSFNPRNLPAKSGELILDLLHIVT